MNIDMRKNKILIFCSLLDISKCERPNILVILLDDLGWADVSWNNHIMQTTPFLEEMSQNGTILVCITICFDPKGFIKIVIRRKKLFDELKFLRITSRNHIESALVCPLKI